jgi:ABC-type glycerol-3-phosphate transport system substrate-binding protein
VLLRIALVAGPVHDQIYRLLDPERVDVVLHADLATVRRRVFAMLAAGEPLDLVSVHSADVPTFARWLSPLDDGLDTHGMLPLAMQLCSWNGKLLAAPRTFDARLTWTRHDMVVAPPTSWSELEEGGATLGFAGRNADVAQLFAEVLAARGGAPLDRGRPSLATPEAAASVAQLVRLARGRAPADLPVWIDDDVENAFGAGRVASAIAWGSAWGRLSRSTHRDRIRVHAPLGPACAARGLGWAIPASAAQPGRARELVARLASLRGQLYDNDAGLTVANVEALHAVEGVAEPDLRRRELLEEVGTKRFLTGFRHQLGPLVEAAVWPPLHAAISGELHPGDAAAAMQQFAETILGKGRPRPAPVGIADRR